jgi:hypothetical protein
MRKFGDFSAVDYFLCTVDVHSNGDFIFLGHGCLSYPGRDIGDSFASERPKIAPRYPVWHKEIIIYKPLPKSSSYVQDLSSMPHKKNDQRFAFIIWNTVLKFSSSTFLIVSGL